MYDPRKNEVSPIAVHGAEGGARTLSNGLYHPDPLVCQELSQDCSTTRQASLSTFSRTGSHTNCWGKPVSSSLREAKWSPLPASPDDVFKRASTMWSRREGHKQYDSKPHTRKRERISIRSTNFLPSAIRN